MFLWHPLQLDCCQGFLRVSGGVSVLYHKISHCCQDGLQMNGVVVRDVKLEVVYDCIDETSFGVLTFLVKRGILLVMNVVMAITK